MPLAARSVPFLALAVCLAGATAASAQDGIAARTSAPAAATCDGNSGTAGLFVVSFDAGKWCVQPPPEARITNRTPVRIRVVGLNHLRYALGMDVQEETSEAYQYLDKLWGSVLGGGFAAFGGLDAGDDADREARLRQAIFELYKASLALDRAIAGATAPLQGVGVDAAGRTTLKTASQPAVISAMATAKTKADDLQKLIESDVEIFFLSQGKYAAYVKEASEGYKAVSGKAATFITLSTLIVEGEERAIGTKKAGTRITANLRATNAAGAKLWIADISYVVQSERPLVAHGGMAFSTVDDVSFEKVRRVNGFSADDLFQKKGDAKATNDFTLFLGWELYNRRTSRLSDEKAPALSVLVSLGTDITEPGKKIYAGPTVGWGRFMLTGGVAISKKLNGEEQVLEPNLFKAVREQNTAGGFVAFTVRVF